MRKKIALRSACFGLKHHTLLLVVLLHAFSLMTIGQSCPNKIENNSIDIRPAVCVGTLSWLQGSTPKGGNGSYSYQWQISKGNCGEGNFESIPGASGKDYMVPLTSPPNSCYRRIVSSGDCRDNSNKVKVDAQVVVNPLPPLITAVNPTCFEPVGTITVTNPAPTAGLTYSIDGINYVNATGVFSGLNSNIYIVTVKYTTGCLSPPAVAVIKPLPVLTGEITPTQGALCGEGASIKLTGTGGSTYQWYHDGIKITGATAAEYDASEVGTYSAEIFDGSCKGKTANKATIIQGIVPTGTIAPSQSKLCAGSSGIQLIANGGTSYQWYKDGVKIEGATKAAFMATQAGKYTADIFNATCQGKTQNEAVVVQNEPIVFDALATDPDCTHALGEITVQNVKGGSGRAALYSNNDGLSFQNTPTFSNLTPGDYKILVKDDIGCTSDAIKVVVHSFVSTLKASTVVSDINCVRSTGSVIVNASGGTSPYQFSVDDKPIQPNNTFDGLAAGSHRAKVTDAAGCFFEANFAVAVINSTLSGTIAVTNATCKEKGSVTAKASGGIPPYSYSLDGSSFQADAGFSGIAAGDHNVVIKDGAGCTFTVPFSVQLIGTYPKLVVAGSVTVCPNNTVNLTDTALVSGSDQNLVYSYWNDATASTPLANPSAVLPGNYFIKAVNEQGCAAIKPLPVLLHIPAEGKIILAGSPNVCFGQTVTLTASQGSTYQWYLNDAPINSATEIVYKAAVAGVYSLAINDGTCTSFAANKVQVQFSTCASNPETAVYVPTAFTPNKNGANDALRPLLHNIASLQYFEVYNRWGQRVFRTTEIGKGWDGTINGISQPGETYSWVLQCTDTDGNVIKQSGRSLLIR